MILMMDLGVNEPISLDTPFLICAMTKLITSGAFMKFYEEGYFQLDDPVSKLLLT